MQSWWSRSYYGLALAEIIPAAFALALFVTAATTGGADSPFAPLLFLPVVLAVVSGRFRFILALGVLLGFGAVALGGSEPSPADIMQGFTLFGLAVCGSAYSRAVKRDRELMMVTIRQKEALLDASRIISASEDLKSAVDSALQLLPGLVPDFRCAAIFLEDDKDGRMRLYDVLGLDRGELSFDTFDPRSESSRWRPTDPAPLYVTDANSLPDAAVAHLDLRARSVLCLSLQSPRAFTESVGMLYVSSARPDAFSNPQIGLLQEFADLIGFPLQKVRLQEGLQHLAFSDPMTGLANYRYFRAELADEVKRASRYEHEVSLIMLDLDHFKSVNDLYGHQIGDLALKWVADIIRTSVREADFPARYGGEEFAVICRETGLEEAAVIANRIRAAVETRSFNLDGEEVLRLTVSAGVASFPEIGPDDTDLIRSADGSLYQAKREGRNRVVCGQDLPEATRITA